MEFNKISGKLVCENSTKESCDMGEVATATIATLIQFAERNQQLMEALKPFAEMLADHHDGMPDGKMVFSINDKGISVGNLRRANAILEESHLVFLPNVLVDLAMRSLPEGSSNLH